MSVDPNAFVEEGDDGEGYYNGHEGGEERYGEEGHEGGEHGDYAQEHGDEGGDYGGEEEEGMRGEEDGHDGYGNHQQHYDNQEEGDYDDRHEQRERFEEIEGGEEHETNGEEAQTHDQGQGTHNADGSSSTDPMIVCELTILPQEYRQTDEFPAHITIAGMRYSLAQAFRMPSVLLEIHIDGLPDLDDTVSLSQVAEEISHRAGAEVGTPASPLRITLKLCPPTTGTSTGTNTGAAGSQQEPSDANAVAGGPQSGIAAVSTSKFAAIATTPGTSSSFSTSTAGANEHKHDALFSFRNGGAAAGNGIDDDQLAVPVDVIRVSMGPADPNDASSADVAVYVKIIRENLLRAKKFLGGYRNKRSGAVVHHATTQTAHKLQAAKVAKFHRETQTVDTQTRSQQTVREIGVQMTKSDLWIDPSKDKLITPRPYLTAHALSQIKHQKAIEIQCFLRMCFAGRRIRRLQEDKDMKEEEDRALHQKQEEEKAKELARQAYHRIHPRSKEDFDTLRRELEAWRLNNVQTIKASGLSPEETQFRLQEVFGKEVVVLQIIDRLHARATKENALAKTEKTLEQMSSMKAWSSADGDIIEVETPFTRRAKELVILYTGLTNLKLSQAERVDVLLNVKYAVKEFDCQLSRDIVELIKREEDLLRRKRSEQSLMGLRKRLSQLFLDFIYTPEFNPEAAAYVKTLPGTTTSTTTTVSGAK